MEADNAASPNLQEGPSSTKRSKRLPRQLWGTPLALERKAALAAQRQKRRRERLRLHAARFQRRHMPDPESEDEDAGGEDANWEDIPGIDPLDSDRGADGEPDQRNENYEDYYGGEGGMQQVEEMFSTPIPTNRRPQEQQVQEETPLARLVRKIIEVKVTSKVSERAIEKLFSLFCDERETIGELLESGGITRSYKKSIKPKALKQIPPIFCSVTIQERRDDETIFRRINNLTTIPKQYLNLPPSGNKKLLCTEATVSLRDIKRQYLRTHKANPNALEHLQHTQISADGVRESNTGKRTFVVVSLRIKDCIYAYKLFNPLIGVKESAPSPKEVLR